jgi:hypothetical protein
MKVMKPIRLSAAKTITLSDQITGWQGALRPSSDEHAASTHAVSTKVKYIIVFVVGLIVGALAVEAKDAQTVGQVAFRDVLRCIDMGP